MITTGKAIEGDWPDYERYYRSDMWPSDNGSKFSMGIYLQVPTQTYNIQNKPMLIGINNGIQMFLRDWHASGSNQNRFLFYFENASFDGLTTFTLGNANHGIEKGDWFAFMFSLDYSGSGVPPAWECWVHKKGDSSATDIATTPLNEDNGPITLLFDNTTSVTALGAHPGWASNYGDFDESVVYITNEFIDWSDPAIRAKFVSDEGKPMDLGADGSALTGTQPKHYAPDGDLTNNRGSQSDWTEFGTIANSATSPSD